MRTTLSEITEHYAPIITDLATCLRLSSANPSLSKISASHYLIQIQHHAKNALLEIKNLPGKKE